MGRSERDCRVVPEDEKLYPEIGGGRKTTNFEPKKKKEFFSEVSKKNTEFVGGSKEIEDGVGVVKKNVSGGGFISCNVKGRNLNVVTCVCTTTV